MLKRISKRWILKYVSSDGPIVTPRQIFYLIMSLGLIVSFISFLLTDGQSLDSVLFDRSDYLMDYFNSIYYSKVGPYLSAKVIYPGLITVFYSITGIVLESIGAGFNSAGGLRGSFAGIASYVIITILFLALLLCVLLRTKQTSRKETILFFILILTSYPMIYCLDRGNSLIMSVVFSLLFFIFFNSEKKEHRYLSYLFLGVAIAIKMYPAFFGILVLKNALERKNYKELFGCILICAIVFIIPFFFTDGNIFDFFNNATKYSNTLWMVGHVNLAGILETTMYIFGVQTPGVGAFGLQISLILMAVGAVAVLADKRAPYWETVSLLVCVQILSVGVAPPYVTTYMLIPAWYFLNDVSSKNKKTFLISFLMATSLIMLPGFWKLNDVSLPYIQAISVLILTIILIYNASKRIAAHGKKPETDVVPDDLP